MVSSRGSCQDTVFKNCIYGRRPFGIGVLREGAAVCRSTDSSGFGWRERKQVLLNLFPVARNEDFFAGLEKEVNAFPCIGDQACRRTRSFEDARSRRETITHHALPRN